MYPIAAEVAGRPPTSETIANEIAATTRTPTRARPQRSFDRPPPAVAEAPKVPVSPTGSTRVAGRLGAGSKGHVVGSGVESSAAASDAELSAAAGLGVALG